MACQPETYYNITPSIFNCLKEKLRKVGYPLDSNEGTVRGPLGIVLNFKWDEADSSLMIEVTVKGFFVTCELINQTLLDNLYDCGMAKV